MSLEARVEQLEKDHLEIKKSVKELTEDNIRTDERYKTMVDMMTTLTSGFSGLSETVHKLLIRFEVNDERTNKNNSWIEGFSVPKIITVIVGIIVIISFWKA